MIKNIKYTLRKLILIWKIGFALPLCASDEEFSILDDIEDDIELENDEEVYQEYESIYEEEDNMYSYDEGFSILDEAEDDINLENDEGMLWWSLFKQYQILLIMIVVGNIALIGIIRFSTKIILFQGTKNVKKILHRFEKKIPYPKEPQEEFAPYQSKKWFINDLTKGKISNNSPLYYYHYQIKNNTPLNNSERKVLLFFYGNACDGFSTLYNTKDLAKYWGYDLLIVDYPTYGFSKGSLHEKSFYESAEVLYEKAKELGYLPKNVVVWGHSLGGAAAIHVASTKKIGTLIVQSTFSSFADIAFTYLPFLNKPLIKQYLMYVAFPFKMNSLEKIKNVTAPTFFVWAENDHIIPWKLTEKLLKNIKVNQIGQYVHAGNHNNVLDKKELYKKLKSFIEEL